MPAPDTPCANTYVYDLPSTETVDRLIVWYDARAAREGRLALSLDAEGLDIAADANRKRVAAYRQTSACLKALRERCCRPETEFRGHLQAKARPKAQVRAPP